MTQYPMHITIYTYTIRRSDLIYTHRDNYLREEWLYQRGVWVCWYQIGPWHTGYEKLRARKEGNLSAEQVLRAAVDSGKLSDAFNYNDI